MYRQLFDNAMGTVPPSTVDVRAIVADRRRKIRHRRMAWSAVGVASLAGALATALMVPGVVIADRPAAGPPDAPIAQRPTPESAEQKAARVQAAWRSATMKAAPTARWKAGHNGSPGGDYYDTVPTKVAPRLDTQTNNRDGEIAEWHTSDSLYQSFGLVEIDGVEGRFFFETWWRERDQFRYSGCGRANGVYTCPEDESCEASTVFETPVNECHRSRGPNGEVIFVRRWSEIVQGYNLPHNRLSVWVRSADGSRVAELVVSNRAGPDTAGTEMKTTSLPMTEEQMTEILLEPRLMI